MARTTVAIIGVGLMGGSLGLALKRTRRYRVLGIGRSRAKLRTAQRCRAVDTISTHLSAVREADVVVIATPVAQIVPTIRKILPWLKAGTVITDVGSAKREICQRIQRLKFPKAIYFVGAHPATGDHRTGVSAARYDLYLHKPCVVVPGKNQKALAIVENLWRHAGARLYRLSAAAHDRAVALISHLPHAMAHALVHTVQRSPQEPLLKKLVAGSFRDLTRVASADPEQWRQIFQMNVPELRRAIRSLRQELKRLENRLSRASLKAYLVQSHRYRRPLFHGH